jgi:hypothetical protein
VKCKVSKVAPEDHRIWTEAKTLGEAANDAPSDENKDAVATKLLATRQYECSKNTLVTVSKGDESEEAYHKVTTPL